MQKIENPSKLPLSKWWTTPSAQAAFERAKQRKQESLQHFLRARKERIDALQCAADQWEVQP